jgi:hypothetical protein
MTQSLTGLGVKRVKVDGLDGGVDGGVTILASASDRPTHLDPVSRSVTGAGEPVNFNEALQQVEGMAVLALPVGIDASGDVP